MAQATQATMVEFTSGELMDIIALLEQKELSAYANDDYHLAKYYNNLEQQFDQMLSKLQDLPGEQRVAKLVMAL